mgnify:CR=1
MAKNGHFWPFWASQMAKRASFLRCLEEDIGPPGHRGPKWPKMAQNGPKWPFWPLGPKSDDYSNLNMASLATWEAQNGHFWPFWALLATPGQTGHL